MSEWIAVGINTLMWLIVGIVGIVKLGGHRSASTRLNTMENDLKDHLNDDNRPHTTCGEHGVLLQTVSETLKRFETSLSTLDVRVYNLVKNGGKPPGRF